LIPLVHSSAGPLLDIVVPYSGLPTGYHAVDASSFAEGISSILAMSGEEMQGMRERGRKNAVERFSAESFERGFMSAWKSLNEKL
jgi:alpha-1,2-mannosyltransferase